MHKGLINFFIICIAFSSLEAQTLLTGTVQDEAQKPVPNINILVYAKGGSALIAFGVSNARGEFSISLQAGVDSLHLEATSIHYRNETISIANKSQQVHFHLVPETQNLQEFVVRASPIEQRGDTISYLVSSFAREQDRSIADVLRQMPGIEVESSGRILYQGDPIQHFYVEGLDLMGGRYGLVSSNLPHRSVASVQVLENHQPIKILEERLPSYRASMNITLKRDITTTGTARLGSGLSPLLWDANITPMMFTRDFQLAGSYQANNTGKDAARQLDALTLEGLRERTENNLQRPSVLGIPALAPPGFKENRHLDNNIHLLNANTLLRLPRDLQLRTNLHYIYDFQQQQGNTRRTLYTPGDTLVFDENIRNELRNNALRGEITLTRNTRDNYLNNKLEFQSHWDKSHGSIRDDGEGMNQKLRNPFHSFSNRLNMVKPLGARLVQLNSFVHYDQSPQTLTVQPGTFTEIFTPHTQQQNLRQESQLKRFSTNHSASLAFGFGRWTLTSRVGFQYQQQKFNSEIFAIHNQQETPAGDNFRNNTLGLRTRAYLQPEIAYKRGNIFSFTANMPVSTIYIKLEDSSLQKQQTLNPIIAEPRLSADYRLGNFWRIRGSYGFGHSFGEMESVHYAYILKNYRSLHLSDTPLRETQTHNFSAFVSYRNPIRSLFSSLTYIYSIIDNNLLYTHSIRDDGRSMLQAIEMPNTAYMHNLNGRVSKYFNNISSTLALQGSYGRTQRQQWVNQHIFNGINHIYTLSPKANILLSEHLSTELKTEWMYYDTWQGDTKINGLDIFRHFASVMVFPVRNQHLSLHGEYYRHRHQNNYFLDLQYRYTIRAHRIDIDVHWLNILNHKTYTDFSVGPFMLTENEYLLRPSQFVVSVRFSF